MSAACGLGPSRLDSRPLVWSEPHPMPTQEPTRRRIESNVTNFDASYDG